MGERRGGEDAESCLVIDSLWQGVGSDNLVFGEGIALDEIDG
jgi:hypothetical protein